MIAAWRVLGALVVVAGCAGWSGSADAQSGAATAGAKQSTASKSQAGTEKKAAKQDPAAAQKFVEAGIAALEAGTLEAAISNLSSGLASGSLPGAQMARALYYRGVAYRKQGKPALAIADLTSALWLRGGLSASQRQDALQNRAAAYREAGLSDQSEADTVQASARAAGKSDEGAKSASPVETAAVPAVKPAATQSADQPASSGTSNGIGDFFSSLFGGSAPAPAAQPPAPGPTASTGSWRNATEVQRPAASVSWAETTTSSTSAPATLGQAAPAQKTAATASGKYRLQVAAVRSQAEAQAVAARMRQKHGPDLGALRTEIDQTVVGNMGTLYRVRIGPFADANEPRALCAKLKGDGLDCMIVTQ
jgi:tetratricopeptide (TPR) repeat protein